MTKREVIKTVFEGEKPPYVPWSFKFTLEAKQQLSKYYGVNDLDVVLGNHILHLGSDTGFFKDLGNNRFQDVFKVVWDRSIEKDIGDPKGIVLPGPTLEGYEFPDPVDPLYFASIEPEISRKPDIFRAFQIGFSLYERAWSMRGMENLLMDFCVNPGFVHELMNRICEYNIAQIDKALEFDIDAVFLGDDWGRQSGYLERVYLPVLQTHVPACKKSRQICNDPFMRGC
jgi:uroporphyrinogen decarboxylase